MDRQDANRDLLNHLSELIENFPDLRFSQILLAYGFVIQDDEVSTQGKLVWKDEFHIEPSKNLKRVSKVWKDQVTKTAEQITNSLARNTRKVPVTEGQS